MKGGTATVTTGGTLRRQARRHARHWLASLVLLAFGWLAPGLTQVAWAQTATVCNAATVKGTDGPIDFGAYCWIDFTPLDLVQAKSIGGQPFQVNLKGGAYLTFSLRIVPGNAAGSNMYAVAVPSWSGAAFGNSAFNNIPGNPILYQDALNGSGAQDTLTLSNLTLHDNGATELPFVFVAADGESTNTGETLSFTTTGAAWTLVSAPGQSNPNRNMPVLVPATAVGNSTGSQTVTETGTAGGTQGEGSYVFTTDNSPGTVTAALQGTGLQGVLFGVKYHTVGLSLTKSHVGQFIAGGTGTYTIDVKNTVVYPQVNPPTELQPVRVVDTLPTGLTYASASGTGWTCSNIGQVVTCDTTALQDLTTSKSFPPISIGVNVASNAPASLTNNAVVSDPTTTTLVYNVCETVGNGVCPNSATSSTGDPTTIIRPNLAVGSTKTVVNLSGGDVEVGDLLRYTITLAETGGVAASNVSVSDPVPAGLVAPSGLDPSSTCTGTVGIAGGVLTVTGISLAANGSCTLVFDMAISVLANPGQTIINVATVTVPNGTGGNVQSAGVTVFDPGVAVPGTKNLYLRNDGTFTTRLSRQRPTANGTAVTLAARGGTDDWELVPVIPTGETLLLPDAISGNIVMATSDKDLNSSRTVRLELRTNAGVLLAQTTRSDISGGTATPYTYSFNLAAASLPDKTLTAGEYLVLRIVNPTFDNRYDITVHQRRNPGALYGDYSYLTFDTTTVISIDARGAYSQAASSGNAQKAGYLTNEHVFLRATVSDPFGTADINAVNIVIKDPSGATVTPTTAMPQLADADTTDGTLRIRFPGPGQPAPRDLDRDRHREGRRQRPGRGRRQHRVRRPRHGDAGQDLDRRRDRGRHRAALDQWRCHRRGGQLGVRRCHDRGECDQHRGGLAHARRIVQCRRRQHLFRVAGLHPDQGRGGAGRQRLRVFAHDHDAERQFGHLHLDEHQGRAAAAGQVGQCGVGPSQPDHESESHSWRDRGIHDPGQQSREQPDRRRLRHRQ